MMHGPGGGAWTLMRRRDLEPGQKLKPGPIKRALRMTAHYKARVITYVVITVLTAVLAAVPPLLLRELIDAITGNPNPSVVNRVAIAGVALAVALAGAGLGSRWISA